MFRSLVCTVLLTMGASAVSAQHTTGYIINNRYHQPNCQCSTCVQLRAQLPATKVAAASQPPVPKKEVAAPKEPPPAPVEPATPVKAVKADADDTRPDTTRADVIRSIELNPNIDAKTKAQILANLYEEKAAVPEKHPDVDLIPKRSDEPSKPGFDLLGALRKRDTKPAVKADTDTTPSPFLPIAPAAPPAPVVPVPAPPADRRESFLLMPIGRETATDAAYEIPNTDIGITVGGKVDYSTSWDINKPVPNGKMLQFWVRPIAKRPDKLKSVAYNWLVLPREDYLLWPDTTRVVLSSGIKNGNYVVILTASYVYLEGETVIQKTAQAISMVQVGDTNVVVPADSGLTGIAKQAYEWTGSVTRAGDYNDAKVKADAKKLSVVFLDIAERIKKGELNDATTIIAATKTANDNAIDNRNEWLPWFTKMSDLLRRGYADGSIKSVAQYEATWREIAAGLAN